MGKLSRPVKPGELVLKAIKKLTMNTGWTARTIVKFIKSEYKVTDPRIGTKVSRALKRGVRLGLLQIEFGRYRMTNMSRLANVIEDGNPCEPLKPKRRQKRRRDPPLRIRSPSGDPKHKSSEVKQASDKK